MDMTQIDEQWLDLPKIKMPKRCIVAISNTGKYRKADGTTGILEIRDRVTFYGKRERCYRVIAEHFLITVKRPDQECIDHITHNPADYNVNNVLNLRWCTKAENSNFEEARENRYKAPSGSKNPMYGRTRENHPNWKGDSKKASSKYRQALNEYRRNPSKENLAILEESRLSRQLEVRRQRRMAMKTSDPI